MIRKPAAATAMFQKWKSDHRYAAVTKKLKIVFAIWARLKLLCVLRRVCSTAGFVDGAGNGTSNPNNARRRKSPIIPLTTKRATQPTTALIMQDISPLSDPQLHNVYRTATIQNDERTR